MFRRFWEIFKKKKKKTVTVSQPKFHKCFGQSLNSLCNGTKFLLLEFGFPGKISWWKVGWGEINSCWHHIMIKDIKSVNIIWNFKSKTVLVNWTFSGEFTFFWWSLHEIDVTKIHAKCKQIQEKFMWSCFCEDILCV